MSYQLINSNAEIIAVHAALLGTGKVLYFTGNDSRLWDPAAINQGGAPGHDTFCCGHAFLSDGRLLVAGGTELYPSTMGGIHGAAGHFRGLRKTVIFNPGTPPGSWQPTGDMIPEPGTTPPQGGGRWYPTLLTLGNGHVLAMSGHPEDSDSRHNNDTLEIFDPASGTWSNAGKQPNPEIPSAYPRLHLLPSGEVFCATPIYDPTQGKDVVRRWTPTTGAWPRVADAPDAGYETSIDWSSVLLPLLPPNYRTRVLVVGKQVARIIDLGDRGRVPIVPDPCQTIRDEIAALRDEVASLQLDLQGAAPGEKPGIVGQIRALNAQIRQKGVDLNACMASQVGAGNPANPIRINCNAVILPDGKILVLGGTTNGSPYHAVVEAELYDPFLDRWTTLGKSTIRRGYHSTVLLLPDGRVWIAGTDGEFRIELFSPPYLSAGPKPTIDLSPISIGYAASLSIGTLQAAQIATVALIRCSSVTHAFNPDQRYVGLQIAGRSSTTLTVASPPDSNVAPPGPYLLFIVDGQGIPSEGRFVIVS